MASYHPGNLKLKNVFPAGFEGTPLTQSGRFRNLEINFVPTMKDALKWKMGGNPDKEKKKNDNWRPEVISGNNFLHEKRNCITWLAHASFYLHIENKKILIDPIFGTMPLVTRFVQTPCNPEDYKNIDYLLLSHNHRDHCDEKSLRAISANNPHLKIFTGLGMDSVIQGWFPRNEIQTAGWFQQYEIEGGIKIFYVPSRHWSKRWLNDDNKSLWGGFIIQYKNKTIYFMGDSGYGNHFKMIAEKFPEPDICLMGVGAFKPEWFMGPSHISPANAARAFNEMKGKTFIPMHYGTFDLSDEPISEPHDLLKELEKNGEINGQLKILKVGEKFIL